jgi:hypothetical protein
MSEWDDFREGNGINKGELEMIGHAEALANPGVALNVEEPLRPGADFHLRFAVATAALLVVLGLGALLMWH